jgi:hypothetical protein
MHSAEESAVGYLLPFGKGTVELILRDCTVTWLKYGQIWNCLVPPSKFQVLVFNYFVFC